MVSPSIHLWLTLFVCCHTLSTAFDKHVLHGKDTNIDAVPFIVSVKLNGKFNQGATIINPSWVLTTASSLDQADDAVITLRSGSAYRESGGYVHHVKSKVVHPQFNNATLDYDFALLEVEPEFTFGKKVAAAKLPKQGESPIPYSNATVSGWGKLDVTDRGYSMNLQSTRVNILSESACKAMNEKWIHLSARMLCANFGGEGSSPCVGDRGGPLVVDGVLIGIVITDSCDKRSLKSNVYSKVSDQREWIDSVTGA